MDSITQAALGAVVACAVVPQRGRFPLLAGAVAGTLPDLDVVTRLFVSELHAFVGHRSATHSFVVMPVVAALAAHALRGWRLSRREWFWLLFWVFTTHIMLDLCTTFGTQIFWPLSRYPHALSIVFIADPIYTLPLLATAIWLWRQRGGGRPRRRVISAALAATTAYLALGGAFKLWAQQSLLAALPDAGTAPSRVLTINAPFTILQWHAIARTEEGDWLGWFSTLHPQRPPEWRFMPAEPGAAVVDAALAQQPEYIALKRFGKGFHRLMREGQHWHAVDMRFSGSFGFPVATMGADGGIEAVAAIVPVQRSNPNYYGISVQDELRALWRRF